LALVVLLAVFARRRETLAFTRLMATEVGSDVVTEEEFEILRSARRRRQTLRRIKRSRGAAAEAVLRRLMRAQMDLALFRGRVDSMSDSALEAQRDVVRQLRGRLAAIR